MHNIRTAVFFGRMLFGSLWASLLLIPSLGLLRWRAEPDLGSHILWLSLAGVMAGNYVFMYVVADRLCRVKERWAVDLVEMVTLVVFVLSLAMTIVLWLAGDAR